MNNTEIRDALSRLHEMENFLEEEYENNGGEVTEHTEEQESAIAALRELLTTEGVDSLGRGLKAKEDQIKSLKAEKDSVTRQINAANNTIDYIKSQIYELMVQTGMEKVKGTFYSFTPTLSVKTSVEKDILNEMFLQKVEEKLRGGKKPIIPADVTITLGASVKALPEDTMTLPAYYSRVESPSVRFTKPRANKEDK